MADWTKGLSPKRDDVSDISVVVSHIIIGGKSGDCNRSHDLRTTPKWCFGGLGPLASGRLLGGVGFNADRALGVGGCSQRPLGADYRTLHKRQRSQGDCAN